MLYKKTKDKTAGRVSNFFKYVTILGIAFLLVSCIGIESKLTINNDGSGKLQLKYTVSKMVRDLGSEDQKKSGLLPLPINEEDFKQSLNGLDGISLNSYSRKEDPDNIYVTVEIEFDDINKLREVAIFKDQNISLSESNGQFVFKERLLEKPEGKPTKESIEMAEKIFSDYKLVFIYNLPKKITYHNIGKILNDGKTVTYSISIAEALKINNDIFAVIKW